LAVHSGAEAVERAAEFRPSLVICDVFMPGLNGIQAAVATRKLLPDCKILLFSGNATRISFNLIRLPRLHE
jgi:CheY-like chemotaxis protein